MSDTFKFSITDNKSRDELAKLYREKVRQVGDCEREIEKLRSQIPDRNALEVVTDAASTLAAHKEHGSFIEGTTTLLRDAITKVKETMT